MVIRLQVCIIGNNQLHDYLLEMLWDEKQHAMRLCCALSNQPTQVMAVLLSMCLQ